MNNSVKSVDKEVLNFLSKKFKITTVLAETNKAYILKGYYLDN